MMSDLFSLFEAPSPAPVTPALQRLPMTEEQRSQLRELFAQLGLTTAREQFAVIGELTGTRIAAVTDLQADHAHRAILGLRRRIQSLGEVRTGNAWDDRDAPTWIDRI